MRFLLCVLFLLAGCANYATEQANAINRVDLATAERLAVADIRAGHEPGKSWYNLSLVYSRQGRNDMARNAMVMSARHGTAGAQQTLAAMGVAVPPSDLAQAPASNTEGLAGALEGFNRGYQGGSVSCTSYGTDDLRRINCR